MIKEKKVDPLEPPKIDLETLEVEPALPFSFEFELITKPEFDTPEYEGTELEVPPVVVAEDDVRKAVDQLRRREAKLQTIQDAQVEEGDILVVDWEAREGDSVEARDDNAYYPFGRGFLAGFVVGGVDEALRGKQPGAQADTKVQVAADDPREELRGRELDLQVTLKEIKRYVLPELDEAFLQRHDYDDEKEMLDDVHKQLVRARERERDREVEDLLVDKLVGGIEMSLPEAFVERELAQWVRRRRTELEMEGIPEEKIAKRLDEERGDAKTTVQRDMRRFFLLDRIAEKEDVKATEGEVLGAIQEIARVYGRPENEVLASFRDGDRLAELATQIRHRKTREVIRRKAKLVEAAAPTGVKAPPAKPGAAQKKAPAKKKPAAKKKDEA
jgi:trigger factor